MTAADAFRGAPIVARRDFLANVRSVRVVVISVLMLLVMVGAAFGISGISPSGPGYEYFLWVDVAYPSNNTSQAGIVTWVSDSFGGPRVGVEVALGEMQGPGTNVFVERERQATNATGWVTFMNLGPGFWPVRLQVGTATWEYGNFIDTIRPSWNFTVATQQIDRARDGSYGDVLAHAIRIDGAPAIGADVRVNGTSVGATDANGFFGYVFDPGVYELNVTYLGESFPQLVIVSEPIPTPFQSGPDAVLFFLLSLMSFFAPIVAIAVSYDALTKERAHGSLELLLVRPASRTGLALGKFLGAFASVALPVLGVSFVALAVISLLAGGWPDATFTATFLVGTMALLATYILIMQVFSTVIKSSGTALLAAVLVFFVFSVIWGVVFFLVTFAMGLQPGSQAYFLANSITSLFNPNGVYQLTVYPAVPDYVLGGLGFSIFGLPGWAGPLASAVWIVGLLLVAVYLFRKKVV